MIVLQKSSVQEESLMGIFARVVDVIEEKLPYFSWSSRKFIDFYMVKNRAFIDRKLFHFNFAFLI